MSYDQIQRAVVLPELIAEATVRVCKACRHVHNPAFSRCHVACALPLAVKSRNTPSSRRLLFWQSRLSRPQPKPNQNGRGQHRKVKKKKRRIKRNWSPGPRDMCTPTHLDILQLSVNETLSLTPTSLRTNQKTSYYEISLAYPVLRRTQRSLRGTRLPAVTSGDDSSANAINAQVHLCAR